MTTKKKKPVESTRNIAMKFENLSRRWKDPDCELSEFEVKMMHAFERELKERGYFESPKAKRGSRAS